MEALLRSHIHLFEHIYLGVSLQEITSTDLYYTDGSASKAWFKLFFQNPERFVYVFGPGQYYAGPQFLHDMIDVWIDSVKRVSSSSETTRAAALQTTSTDTPQALPEIRSPALPPTS